MIPMEIHNIASYKFITLRNLAELQQSFFEHGLSIGLKGTILLSDEGINLSLAGTLSAINLFKTYMQQQPYFADMSYRESISATVPFRRLKVKIRNETIKMKAPQICEEKRAPAISPQEFKKWQDEGKEITILDTRNDYEIRFGTFNDAVNLKLNHFNEFPQASENLAKDKPIVMFCTGGIRCEKAAVHLLEKGFKEVYQLDGGILNYFKEVGGAHYQGECFIFDGRLALNAELQETGTKQCVTCYGPIKIDTQVCQECFK
jgi:UPF0176 protein